MEVIAEGNPLPDGAVVIMDADSIMERGALAKSLPLFRLQPTIAAVTTNERGRVKGPAWFAEWISLRFGLRHRTMCSISLSGKLLCLTGRLSIFRASIVADPTFRQQVEKDVIQHWLWGPFEMLSGDDKSTWYWLAKNGHRMLYVPDAMVTTIEVVSESSIRRALANIRRWSGNSLRHSWRAIELGPRKLGWFPWWSLCDQRLAMWTVLFGPTVALLSLAAGRYELAAGYLLWVLGSRIAHASIAWRHGRRFSAYYVPLQILSDWAVALLKVWVLFHPAKQNWLNRGARTMDTTRQSAFFVARKSMAHYLWGFTCAMLVIGIGIAVGLLPLLRDARLFMEPTPVKTVDHKKAPQASVPNRALLGMTVVKPGSDVLPRPVLMPSSQPLTAGTDNKSKRILEPLQP
jgi:glycosyltransferase Alg8